MNETKRRESQLIVMTKLGNLAWALRSSGDHGAAVDIAWMLFDYAKIRLETASKAFLVEKPKYFSPIAGLSA